MPITGSRSPRAGHCFLDGGQSCHLERILRGPAGSILHGLCQKVYRYAVPGPDRQGSAPGKYLRANLLKPYNDQENGDWKLLVWDKTSGRARMPKGTIGYRWQTEKGKWNLEMKDGVTDEELDPELSFLDQHDSVAQVEFDDFAGGTVSRRGVPVRTIETSQGKITVATVFDLMMAQFGVDRGLEGDYPKSYDDEACYTPAWQEKFSGIHRDTCLRYAREWAVNAEKTNGKNLVIIGAGANHWYHNNLLYRSAITALMLTGSVGVNGGGLAHYVGQEKLANHASWGAIAFAGDWKLPNRQQNTPSFHYVHTDQWRYERGFTAYDSLPGEKKKEHTIDYQARAVRQGGCRSSHSSTRVHWKWSKMRKRPAQSPKRRSFSMSFRS